MLLKVDSSSTFCNKFQFCCSSYQWTELQLVLQQIWIQPLYMWLAVAKRGKQKNMAELMADSEDEPKF